MCVTTVRLHWSVISPTRVTAKLGGLISIAPGTRRRKFILSVPVAQARSGFLLSSFTALAGTVAVQAGTQLLVFAAGIIVVRNLSIEQYAYYTLATAALGVAGALSDSGMTSALIGQCGRVWREPDRLGAVMATGLALRR